jgi:hypothetical protein
MVAPESNGALFHDIPKAGCYEETSSTLFAITKGAEVVPRLSDNLLLVRCPHCSVANPNLRRRHNFETNNHAGNVRRIWAIYVCETCGGVVSAWSSQDNQEAIEHFPQSASVDDDIPERPKTFLRQAQESLHAPAGAVMLAASAVDAMLKQRGYTDGSLYVRIEKAEEDHMLTTEMASWAHAVRLDANDQRHADEEAVLPTTEDAKRVLEFALALGEYLFVLPCRITRGIKAGAP